jgi:surface polysaccharide O-acyltransferase-like enzyme
VADALTEPNLGAVSAPTRLAYLDVLRWVATAAVVLLHVVAGVWHTFPEKLDSGQLSVFMAVHWALLFCVPSFVMITGALFLNPQKRFTPRTLAFKYVRRIVLALCLFGYPMAVVEALAGHGAIRGWADAAAVAGQGLLNFLAGHSWSHMWYLYMLVGLYLCLPVFKFFVAAAPKGFVYLTVGALFVFTSLFPLVESLFGVAIGFPLPIGSVYVLYLLLGYLIRFDDSPIWRRAGLWAAVGAASLAGLVALGCFQVGVDYDHPLVVACAVALFVWLARPGVDYGRAGVLAAKTQYLCLGVYIVHPVFLNFAYKKLDIFPMDLPLPVGIAAFFIGAFVCAVLASWLLNLIPPLRKYVL